MLFIDIRCYYHPNVPVTCIHQLALRPTDEKSKAEILITWRDCLWHSDGCPRSLPVWLYRLSRSSLRIQNSNRLRDDVYHVHLSDSCSSTLELRPVKSDRAGESMAGSTIRRRTSSWLETDYWKFAPWAVGGGGGVRSRERRLHHRDHSGRW